MTVLKHRTCVATVASILLLLAVNTPANAQSNAPAASGGMFSEPLSFQPNQGQESAGVHFSSTGAGYKLLLTDRDATLILQNSSTAAAVRMSFADSRPATNVSGSGLLSSINNYYEGNDRSKWITGVPGFERVSLRGIYQGIDLVYYGNKGELEYDFVVAPGADPGKIEMVFDGTQGIATTPSGDLRLALSGGPVFIRKPIVYQELQGRRQIISSAYRIAANGHVRFALGSYDARLPLIVDPSIAFNEYLDGTPLGATVSPRSTVVGSTGIVYATGYTNTGNVWVKRFDPACLVGTPGCTRWTSASFTGNSADFAKDIAMDGFGNVWVLGSTNSTDFPATGTPAQGNLAGYDVFLMKLNPATLAMTYSTYLGGNGKDLGDSLAISNCVGVTCDIYVAGTGGADLGSFLPSFTNFPGTTPVTGSDSNGFVIRLLATTSTLTPASGKYVGVVVNNNMTNDGIPSLDVAAGGNTVALAGAKAGPKAHVWLLNSGAERSLHTLTDGRVSFANTVAVGPDGNVHVAGQTNSALGFPRLCTPVVQFCQLTYNALAGTFLDAFYAKVDSVSGGIIYATYLGSPLVDTNDVASGIAVSADGNVLITGKAGNQAFPHDGTPLSFLGTSAGFLAAFSPSQVLMTSSFLRSTGGADAYEGTNIALFANGDAVVLGKAIGGASPGPFVVKVAGPAAQVPGFSSFALTMDSPQPACPVGEPLASPPCYWSEQSPDLNPPLRIATVTLALTQSLPLTSSVFLELLDDNNNPIDQTGSPTWVLTTPVLTTSPDRKTFTFGILYRQTPPPGLAKIRVRAGIDSEKCTPGNPACFGMMTIVGLPGISGAIFAPNFVPPGTVPVYGSVGKVVGGNTTSGKITLNAAAEIPLTVFLSSSSPLLGLPASTAVNPSGTIASNTSEAFTITTPSVTTITPITVTGSLTGGGTGTAHGAGTITILPDLKLPALPFGFTLSPNPVGGVFSGTSIQAAVALDNGAIVPDDPIYPVDGLTFHLLKIENIMGTLTETVVASGRIPRGQSTGSLTFAAENVSSTTVFTYRARIDAGPETNLSYSVTVPLTVNPITVLALSLNPTSLVGGSSFGGTVTIVAPAPAGGVTVALTAPWGLSTTVVVPQGQTVASFSDLIAPSVAATTTFPVTAALNGTTRIANLQVLAVTPTSFTLTPTTVGPGGSSTAAVTLNGPAPAGGATVVLSSPGFGTIPPIVIPAGATTGSVLITAPLPAVTTTYTVSASLNGTTLTQNLTVSGNLSVSAISMTPNPVASGAQFTLAATLSAPAPATGAQVIVTLPWATTVTVNVPSGATTGQLLISAPKVTQTTTYTLSAVIGTTTPVTGNLVVTLQPTLLTLTPSTVVTGGSVAAQLTLNGSTGGQVSATLLGLPSGPVTILVPANSNTGSATFAAPAAGTYTLSVTLDGVTVSRTLTVQGLPTATLTLTPATVASGGITAANITLSQTTTVPLTFTLTPSFSVASPLPTITIPAGALTGSAPVSITAPRVTSTQTYTVSAQSPNGVSASSALTVILAPVQLTLTPSTVITGGGVTAQILLNGVAGGAVSVTVTGLPTALTIPVNSSSTGSVLFTAPAPGAYVLTATLNGVSVSAPLQVNAGTLTVPFSKFNVDVAVGFKWGDDRDTFRVRGEFSLGNASNGINPVTEAVALKVGPYSVLIPAGSFKLSGDRDGDGDLDHHGCRVVRRYRFKGTIGGVDLDVRIRYFGNNEYDLRVHAKKADMTGVVKGQPITVNLAIGNDSGSATDLRPKTRIRDLKVKVSADLSHRSNRDTFDIDADLVFAEDDDSLNPATQVVTLQLGAYSVTIPAGSFKLSGDRDGDGDIDRNWSWNQGRTFNFNGTIDGDTFDIRIRDLGHNVWDLQARGGKLDLTDILENSPVTVSLTIGGVNAEADDLDPKVH